MKRIDSEAFTIFSKKVNEAEKNQDFPSVQQFCEKHTFNNPFVDVDVREMCKIFFYAWKDMDVIRSDATLARMINYIFNYDHIMRDITFIDKRIPLAGQKVLDTGCCWGSLAYFLRKYDCNVSCIDYIEAHALFTKFLIPQVDVYLGDVRDMSMFEDRSFDVVISRGVIEHVGDYSLPRGRSTEKSFDHQRRYMREMKRIVKENGHIWLSTGNFFSPYDGEIEQWFFHWLPEDLQNAYLAKAKEGADKYWLLTWPQMESLFEEFSLEVEDVFSPDSGVWLEPMSDLFKYLGRHKDILIPMMMEQCARNPNFMPNWIMTLKNRLE